MDTWYEVRIQTRPFDLGQEAHFVRMQARNIGALVAFQGMVREFNWTGESQDAPIESLFLEHDPNVTENEIARIIDIACNRWSLSAVQVVHRVGYLLAGEPVVLVLVSAQHRDHAFQATQFIMDFLKTQAPLWKCEQFTNGETDWVAAKISDQDAQLRWVMQPSIQP